MADDLLRAAGVVVLRGPTEQREVLLVHRPSRADWSLPKGKLDPGEHPVAAAVRECDEETGYQVVLGPHVGTMDYIAGGRPKRVDYWVAHVAADVGFAPDDEVDAIAWVAVGEVGAHLTYASDHSLIERAVALPPTSPLVILRHAKAMRRADFQGDDDLARPLSGRGRSEARGLAPLMEAFGVARVHSSEAVRCLTTAGPFARRLATDIIVEDALTERPDSPTPEQVTERVAELYDTPVPTVVVTHRPILPMVIEGLVSHAGVDPQQCDPRLSPAAFLVIHRDSRGVPVGVERHFGPGRTST